MKPDYLKSALVIIDTQNDFSLPGAVSEIPGTFEIIPNIEKLANFFRSKKLPIIHIVRLYKNDGSNVDLCRKQLIEDGKRIVEPDSEGSQIVEKLLSNKNIKLDTKVLFNNEFQKIGDKEWIMYKPRWGAFYQTKLEEHLRFIDINTLVFCGCNFPNCLRTSIYEGSERDFKIAFISEAASQVYYKGLQELSNIGVDVLTLEAFNKKLQH
ncbi:MAG: cysteine hydrolase [Spirochaetales bacterium]|nr:cysteine hydrolase [Spirochaetales bacterium]